MGCVYQAPNNKSLVWFVKYKVPTADGGWTYKVESSRTTDKREAQKLLRRRETDVDDGKPVAQTTGRKHAYTFEVARDTMISEYRRRSGDASAQHLANQINKHLLPVFGGRRMQDITRDQIAAHADARLKTGAANATVQKELRMLSRMFTLGIVAERLSWKPAMPQIGVDNARQGFFERADFEAVRSRMPEHYRDLLTITWWSGWRMQSEVATLEWRHIDVDARELRIFTSKNGEGRVFPYGMLPDVCAAVERLAARRETLRDRGILTGTVFTFDDGVPVTRSFPSMLTPQLRKDFRDAWKAACKAAGVAGRIPHDLRRTAVRNLCAAGVPDKVAMQITGHKTRSVFDRYHIVNTTDLSEALGKLAARQTRTTTPAVAPAQTQVPTPARRRRVA